MSNLRLSPHKLEIERGRYNKPHPQPADKRHCVVCRTGDIEDEIHFLCHCEGYKELRSKFIRYLEMNGHGDKFGGFRHKRYIYNYEKEYSY